MRLRPATGGIVLAMLLTTTVNGVAGEYAPSYERIRAGLRREPVASRLVVRRVPAAVVARSQSGPKKPRASLWRGAGIGALIGGLVWAPSLCGSNDPECSAITVPVGVAAGAGIGAAVGAIGQALAR